ncbi:hypothetical protein CPLU01_06039 [Colletotrichum plurivorum]|uniref:Uncharacterized protein n=1 Tax=Colletotrichum plurivorum TaxID=2175906 RepID=A0A8H6KKI6_9PEZI|nr:hypothetical protein CPLU01_06039 [Colletotrichum plurivorum]
MVLSLLISFGTVVGAHEGIKASQAKARKEEHRSRKNNLVVHCPKSSQYSLYLENRRVVLSGDRLYIDTGTAHDVPFGHPFEGYYLPYPDCPYGGLVTTITHEAPIMNWVFVCPVTYQLKFGVRAVADYHLTGPFDCTRQDRRLTFGGWEGFCAVLEDTGVWGLYFDIDGDGMRKKFGQEGRVVIEIDLSRRELREPKPQIIVEPPPEEATAAQQEVPKSEQQGQSQDPQLGADEAASSQLESSTTKEDEVGEFTLQELRKRVAAPDKAEELQVKFDDLRVQSPKMAPSVTSSEGSRRRGRRRSRNNKKYKSPSVENSEEDEAARLSK